MVLNSTPLVPVIRPAPPGDRRRARAAGGLPRRPLPDAGDTASETSSHLAFECIALLLQGGGALGAHQAGPYEALTERDLHPNWIAGISIGAIDGALIAGNAPEARVNCERSGSASLPNLGGIGVITCFWQRAMLRGSG
jgi:predicted acylesterase/phospholipase RssA